MAYFKFTSVSLWREFLRWDGEPLTSAEVRLFRNAYHVFEQTGVTWMSEDMADIATVPVVPYVEVRYLQQTYLVDTLTNDVCRPDDKTPIGKVGVGYFKCVAVPTPPVLPPAPAEEIERVWKQILALREGK